MGSQTATHSTAKLLGQVPAMIRQGEQSNCYTLDCYAMGAGPG